MKINYTNSNTVVLKFEKTSHLKTGFPNKKELLNSCKARISELMRLFKQSPFQQKIAINTLGLVIKAVQECVNTKDNLSINLKDNEEINGHLLATLLNDHEFMHELGQICSDKLSFNFFKKGNSFNWHFKKTNYSKSAEEILGFLYQYVDPNALKIVAMKQTNTIKKVPSLKNITVDFDFDYRRNRPYPLPDLNLNDKMVVGDLHGNFHKLLDHFIRVGALVIKPSIMRPFVNTTNSLFKETN